MLVSFASSVSVSLTAFLTLTSFLRNQVSHVAVGISNSTWQKRLQAVRLYVQDLVWNALERIPQPRVEVTLLDVQGLEKNVDLSTLECVVEWGGKEVLRVFPQGAHPEGDSIRPSTQGTSEVHGTSRDAADRKSDATRSSNRSSPGKVRPQNQFQHALFNAYRPYLLLST